jgi:flagellar biosynthesis chaperone FliJ
MKPFRFRAAAALDLRRQQEDAARLTHTIAANAARAADARLADAVVAVRGAEQTSAATTRAGVESWLLTWHRCWIDRLRLEAGARRTEAAVSAAAVERAAASVRKAHQRRLTLERLRDRNELRYNAEVQRDELKEMNLFAGLRFAGRSADERNRR